MTVRARAVIFVAGMVVVGLLAIHLISHLILLPSYASLETQFVTIDIQRVLGVIETRLRTIDAVCYEWASWSGMDEHAESHPPSFADPAPADPVFEAIRLNIAGIYDAEGRPVVIRAFDLISREQVEPPQEFLAHTSSDSPLLQHAISGLAASGVLCLSDGPVLFSARPILSGGDEQSARGVLILASSLDAESIEQLRDVTRLQVSLSTTGESAADLPLALPGRLDENAPVFVTPLSAKTISAEAVVSDVYGAPLLRVSIVQSRDIYAAGQYAIGFFLAVLAVSGILFSVAALWLVDRTLFRRLTRLAEEVRAIGDQADFHGEVSVSGEDEISFLAGTINEALAALARTHRQLHASHAELQQTTDSLKHTQRELGVTANRLRRLTRHLQSLREDERAVVASEIHDQIGQGLAALKLDLSSMEMEASRGGTPSSAILRQMNEVVDTLQRTVRRLAGGLRPSIVEELGLTEALAWRLDEFGKAKAIATALSFQGPVGDVESGRARTIFRILQEALLVAGEDTTITRVSVTLTIASRYALLAIEDNGQGNLEGDALSRREMGLSLIRELVEVFGGGVTIKGAPGTGTTVVSQVPL